MPQSRQSLDERRRGGLIGTPPRASWFAAPLLFVCAALGSCIGPTGPLASPEADLQARTLRPPPGKALVYIAWDWETMSSRPLLAVSSGDQILGLVRPKTYQMFTLDPGPTTIGVASVVDRGWVAYEHWTFPGDNPASRVTFSRNEDTRDELNHAHIEAMLGGVTFAKQIKQRGDASWLTWDSHAGVSHPMVIGTGAGQKIPTHKHSPVLEALRLGGRMQTQNDISVAAARAEGVEATIVESLPATRILVQEYILNGPTPQRTTLDVDLKPDSVNVYTVKIGFWDAEMGLGTVPEDKRSEFLSDFRLALVEPGLADARILEIHWP